MREPSPLCHQPDTATPGLGGFAGLGDAVAAGRHGNQWRAHINNKEPGYFVSRS